MGKRQLHVHSIKPRDHGERQQHYRKRGENFNDLVGLVANEDFIGVLESLGQIFKVFQTAPNFLNFIHHVVEVHFQFFGEEFFILMLKLSNDRTLRRNDAAAGDDVFFEPQNVPHHVFFRLAVEHVGLNRVHGPFHVIQYREHVVEQLPDDDVQQVTAPLLQHVLAGEFIAFAFFHERTDCFQLRLVQGDEVVLPDKNIHLFLYDALAARIIKGEMEYNKQIIVVVVDFGPLHFGQTVFQIQFVKIMLFFEHFHRFLIGADDIRPGKLSFGEGLNLRTHLYYFTTDWSKIHPKSVFLFLLWTIKGLSKRRGR